jgi:hypothetical protein
MISEYDSVNNVAGTRIGTSASPINFYEMKDTTP